MAPDLAELRVDVGAKLGVEIGAAAHGEDLHLPGGALARARVHADEDARVGGEVLAQPFIQLGLVAGHDDEALLGAGHPG